VRTPHFQVNHVANHLAYHRLGPVVPKRLGGAVVRNRVKRRLREWFRLNKEQLPQPYKDIVIVARPGAGGLSWTEMTAELAGALCRRGNSPS
jgi:ribonuclease P protein component